MNLRPYLQFNRYLSAPVSGFLSRTALSPNSISLLGALCGVLGAAAMAQGTRVWMLAGAFAFHAAFILDNADGEVARIKNLSSRFGRYLDMGCDVFVDFMLWTGLYFGALRTDWPIDAVWLYAALAGSCVNFGISLWERTAGCSSSLHLDSPVRAERKNSFFFSLLDTAAHNGDSVALIWLIGLAALPGPSLACGAVFIHGLWILRFVSNGKKLLAPENRKPGLYALKGFAGLFGVWVLFETSKHISWAGVAALFREAGWGMIAVFMVFPVVTFFHTLALRALFSRDTRSRMGLLGLFGIKLTGESINKVTPFIDVGGEPAKAILIHRRGLAGIEESLAALGAFRVSFVVSEIFCLVAGLAAATMIKPSAAVALWTLAAIAASAVSIFLIVGSFKALVSLGIKLSAKEGEAVEGMASRIHGRLNDLIAAGNRDFWVSVFWSFLGWVFFFFEVYFAFKIFGVELSAAEAFAIQSLLQAVTTLTFFVPAGIGTQEGGLAYLLGHLNHTATEGVALSLLKRVRQVFWALLAIPLYFALKHWKVTGRT